MIKNIIFDMGGVLLHFSPAHFIDLLSLPEEDKTPLLLEVFNTVEWFRLDRGTITEEEAAAAMKRNLPPRLHSAVDRLVEWWELDLRPMEGMEELLAELKELGYDLYLLSNATLRQPEYFNRLSLSQYFDGRVISAWFKVLKPQKEIFDILLWEYDLKAEECFFVDDSVANVEGAYC